MSADSTSTFDFQVGPTQLLKPKVKSIWAVFWTTGIKFIKTILCPLFFYLLPFQQNTRIVELKLYTNKTRLKTLHYYRVLGSLLMKAEQVDFAVSIPSA